LKILVLNGIYGVRDRTPFNINKDETDVSISGIRMEHKIGHQLGMSLIE
jgi:hypothetical protein